MIPFLICFVLSFSETVVYVNAMEVFAQMKDWYKKYKWLFITIATLFFVAESYILDEVFYIKIATTVIAYIITAGLIVKDKISVKLSMALTYQNFLVMLEY